MICFDIGGTNVKYGLIGADKKIKERGSFETNLTSGESVLNHICQIIKDACLKFNVIGISVSCPGFINPTTGLIEAGNIISGFNGLNLKEYLSNQFHLPVVIENDANCATIAEHCLGNGVGCKNLVCVTLGTGVGGGMIINNQIYHGSHFMAGEFGFMLVNGIHHHTIEDDIFSQYASTRSLVEKTSAALGYEIDGIKLFELAESGDIICQEMIHQFYDDLAKGIYNICYLLNPEKVLIGGAISMQEGLIDQLKKRLSQFKLSFSRDLTAYIEFDTCRFLNESGLLGSYCNFINQYKGE